MAHKRRRKKGSKKAGGMHIVSKPSFGERKFLYISFALSIGICLLLMGGYMPGTGQEQMQEVMGAAIEPVEYGSNYPYTRADFNTVPENALEINLSQMDVEYTITDAGDYLLYGDYEGRICIDAEEQIVHLFLNNVNIMSPSGPAIDIQAAGKVIITVMDNTSNAIQDKAYYRKQDEEDAAIYSNCDLSFNGNGVLSVYGLYNKGIHSKDIIKILGGDISIQAKGDGIQGNDGICLSPTTLSIESEGHGLYTKKTGNENKGTIEISGGDIQIIAGENAVSSSKDLYVSNCSLWINSVLDAFHVSGSAYLMEGCIENE